MDLSFEHPGDYLFVRRVGAKTVTIVDRDFHASLLLTPEQVVEDWPVRDATRLSAADIEPILALNPELILLGTGERQVFPPAEFMAALLRKGIGVEAMTNAAAARTFTLLAGEGRRVLAAFILP